MSTYRAPSVLVADAVAGAYKTVAATALTPEEQMDVDRMRKNLSGIKNVGPETALEIVARIGMLLALADNPALAREIAEGLRRMEASE